MTMIAKLRYILLSLLVALAFGFAGVAQADIGTAGSAESDTPETIQWDEEDDDEWGDDDWDDGGDEW